MRTIAHKRNVLGTLFATIVAAATVLPANAIPPKPIPGALARLECTSNPSRPAKAEFLQSGDLHMVEGPGDGSGAAGFFLRNIPQLKQFSLEFKYVGTKDVYGYPHLFIMDNGFSRVYSLANYRAEGAKVTVLPDGWTRFETEGRISLNNVDAFGVYVKGNGDTQREAFVRNITINNEKIIHNDLNFVIDCGAIRLP